uniref:Genome polyprotein n=1 Tax=Xiamen fanray pesti-like virus TaxID=2116479 RepID=A0A2P1GN57_9FLAV|nr:polyprotein [Xiamen fanray pesti-like virus]
MCSFGLAAPVGPACPSRLKGCLGWATELQNAHPSTKTFTMATTCDKCALSGCECYKQYFTHNPYQIFRHPSPNSGLPSLDLEDIFAGVSDDDGDWSDCGSDVDDEAWDVLDGCSAASFALLETGLPARAMFMDLARDAPYLGEFEGAVRQLPAGSGYDEVLIEAMDEVASINARTKWLEEQTAHLESFDSASQEVESKKEKEKPAIHREPQREKVVIKSKPRASSHNFVRGPSKGKDILLRDHLSPLIRSREYYGSEEPIPKIVDSNYPWMADMGVKAYRVYPEDGVCSIFLLKYAKFQFCATLHHGTWYLPYHSVETLCHIAIATGVKPKSWGGVCCGDSIIIGKDNRDTLDALGVGCGRSYVRVPGLKPSGWPVLGRKRSYNPLFLGIGGHYVHHGGALTVQVRSSKCCCPDYAWCSSVNGRPIPRKRMYLCGGTLFQNDVLPDPPPPEPDDTGGGDDLSSEKPAEGTHSVGDCCVQDIELRKVVWFLPKKRSYIPDKESGTVTVEAEVGEESGRTEQVLSFLRERLTMAHDYEPIYTPLSGLIERDTHQPVWLDWWSWLPAYLGHVVLTLKSTWWFGALLFLWFSVPGYSQIIQFHNCNVSVQLHHVGIDWDPDIALHVHTSHHNWTKEYGYASVIPWLGNSVVESFNARGLLELFNTVGQPACNITTAPWADVYAIVRRNNSFILDNITYYEGQHHANASLSFLTDRMSTYVVVTKTKAFWMPIGYVPTCGGHGLWCLMATVQSCYDLTPMTVLYAWDAVNITGAFGEPRNLTFGCGHHTWVVKRDGFNDSAGPCHAYDLTVRNGMLAILRDNLGDSCVLSCNITCGNTTHHFKKYLGPHQTWTSYNGDDCRDKWATVKCYHLTEGIFVYRPRKTARSIVRHNVTHDHTTKFAQQLGAAFGAFVRGFTKASCYVTMLPLFVMCGCLVILAVIVKSVSVFGLAVVLLILIIYPCVVAGTVTTPVYQVSCVDGDNATDMHNFTFDPHDCNSTCVCNITSRYTNLSLLWIISSGSVFPRHGQATFKDFKALTELCLISAGYIHNNQTVMRFGCTAGHFVDLHAFRVYSFFMWLMTWMLVWYSNSIVLVIHALLSIIVLRTRSFSLALWVAVYFVVRAYLHGAGAAELDGEAVLEGDVGTLEACLLAGLLMCSTFSLKTKVMIITTMVCACFGHCVGEEIELQAALEQLAVESPLPPPIAYEQTPTAAPYDVVFIGVLLWSGFHACYYRTINGKPVSACFVMALIKWPWLAGGCLLLLGLPFWVFSLQYIHASSFSLWFTGLAVIQYALLGRQTLAQKWVTYGVLRRQCSWVLVRDLIDDKLSSLQMGSCPSISAMLRQCRLFLNSLSSEPAWTDSLLNQGETYVCCPVRKSLTITHILPKGIGVHAPEGSCASTGQPGTAMDESIVCTSAINPPSAFTRVASVFGVGPAATAGTAAMAVGDTTIYTVARGTETGYAFSPPGSQTTVVAPWHLTKGKALIVNVAGTDISLLAKAGSAESDICLYGKEWAFSPVKAGQRAYICRPTGKGGLLRYNVLFQEGRWIFSDAMWVKMTVPVAELKGISGCPIITDEGLIVGMASLAICCGGTAIGYKDLHVPSEMHTSVEPSLTTAADFSWTEIVNDMLAMKQGDRRTISAPTGSGKTTVLPLRLVAAHKTVMVLVPTNAAICAVYQRVAKNSQGATVALRSGDKKVGKLNSSILFCTYGYFLAYCSSGVGLQRVTQLTGLFDYILLDEVHVTAPEVYAVSHLLTGSHAKGKYRVARMSASLGNGEVSTPYPVTVQKIVATGTGPLGIDPVILKGKKTLIFLPTKKMCEASARVDLGVPCTYFYSGMDPDVLAARLRDCTELCVFATDALSTGITLDLDIVCDSCEAVYINAVADYEDYSYALVAQTLPISRSMGIQRAGRCGRTRPGTYYYSRTFAREEPIASASILEAFVLLYPFGRDVLRTVDISVWPELAPLQHILLHIEEATVAGVPYLSRIGCDAFDRLRLALECQWAGMVESNTGRQWNRQSKPWSIVTDDSQEQEGWPDVQSTMNQTLTNQLLATLIKEAFEAERHVPTVFTWLATALGIGFLGYILASNALPCVTSVTVLNGALLRLWDAYEGIGIGLNTPKHTPVDGALPTSEGLYDKAYVAASSLYESALPYVKQALTNLKVQSMNVKEQLELFLETHPDFQAAGTRVAESAKDDFDSAVNSVTDFKSLVALLYTSVQGFLGPRVIERVGPLPYMVVTALSAYVVSMGVSTSVGIGLAVINLLSLLVSVPDYMGGGDRLLLVAGSLLPVLFTNLGTNVMGSLGARSELNVSLATNLYEFVVGVIEGQAELPSVSSAIPAVLGVLTNPFGTVLTICFTFMMVCLRTMVTSYDDRGQFALAMNARDLINQGLTRFVGEEGGKGFDRLFGMAMSGMGLITNPILAICFAFVCVMKLIYGLNNTWGEIYTSIANGKIVSLAISAATSARIPTISMSWAFTSENIIQTLLNFVVSSLAKGVKRVGSFLPASVRSFFGLCGVMEAGSGIYGAAGLARCECGQRVPYVVEGDWYHFSTTCGFPSRLHVTARFACYSGGPSVFKPTTKARLSGGIAAVRTAGGIEWYSKNPTANIKDLACVCSCEWADVLDSDIPDRAVTSFRWMHFSEVYLYDKMHPGNIVLPTTDVGLAVLRKLLLRARGGTSQLALPDGAISMSRRIRCGHVVQDCFSVEEMAVLCNLGFTEACVSELVAPAAGYGWDVAYEGSPDAVLEGVSVRAYPRGAHYWVRRKNNLYKLSPFWWRALHCTGYRLLRIQHNEYSCGAPDAFLSRIATAIVEKPTSFTWKDWLSWRTGVPTGVSASIDAGTGMVVLDTVVGSVPAANHQPVLEETPVPTVEGSVTTVTTHSVAYAENFVRDGRFAYSVLVQEGKILLRRYPGRTYQGPRKLRALCFSGARVSGVEFQPLARVIGGSTFFVNVAHGVFQKALKLGLVKPDSFASGHRLRIVGQVDVARRSSGVKERRDPWISDFVQRIIGTTHFPVVITDSCDYAYYQSMQVMDSVHNPVSKGTLRGLYATGLWLLKKELGRHKSINFDDLQLNLKSSLGFFAENPPPYKNLKEAMTDYKDIFEKRVNKIVTACRGGTGYMCVQTVMAKKERKANDLDNLAPNALGKARLIQYGDCDWRAAGALIAGTALRPGLSYRGDASHSFVGHVFGRAYEAWRRRKKPVAVCLDVSKWDTRLTVAELEILAELEARTMRDGDAWRTYRACEMRAFLLFRDGQIGYREGGRGSGEVDTSLGNTLWNSIIVHYNMMLAKVDIDSFDVYCCGDDAFVVMEEEHLELYLTVQAELYRELGKPLKVQIAERFEDINYCSCSPGPILHDGQLMFLPTRPLPVILGKLCLFDKEEMHIGSKLFSYAINYCGNSMAYELLKTALQNFEPGQKYNYPTWVSKEFTFLNKPMTLNQAIFRLYGVDMTKVRWQTTSAKLRDVRWLSEHSKIMTARGFFRSLRAFKVFNLPKTTVVATSKTTFNPTFGLSVLSYVDCCRRWQERTDYSSTLFAFYHTLRRGWSGAHECGGLR